jgi:phosphoglucosamine mutase
MMCSRLGANAIVKMAKQLFGTDGIRGLPGEYPLDDATLERVGAALGAYLRAHSDSQTDSKAGAAKPRVLIGRDTRESGPHIAELIARGLTSAGAEPVSAGVVTTPGVAWLVSRENFAAGVVISASHNPYHDNGVKLISHNGMKFPDAVEAEIEKLILTPASAGSSESASRVHLEDNEAIDDDYLAGLRQTVLPGAKLAGMKIVLDCANGAASALAPKLFRSLGADVIALNNAPDGKNINAGCGSLHPEAMQQRVRESGAALGVAFDGDADRALFATASGALVNGDGVLLVLGRYMKSQKKLNANVIVGTTMANLGLERALENSGLSFVRTAVGDRYVLEEMQRIGANLGGEQSGHILLLDDATTGDGMLTAIKIASVVSISGPLDSLVADLKNFPQKIVNVKVKSKPPLETLPEVWRRFTEAEKTLGKSGRVVLRYSGTEPLARVMVEAEHDSDVHHWTKTLADALRESIGA